VAEPASRAALLATGEELVRGAIVDSNSAWIARRLAPLGIEVAEVRVVGDQPAAIEQAVRELSQRVDLLIVGGGLGPTPDDRTRDAIAAAAGVALATDPEAAAQLAAWFARLGRAPSASNARQALLPIGARAIANPRGSAPGIALAIGRAQLFALPGVPAEMRPMIDAAVVPWIRARGAGTPWIERLLQVVGLPESVAGERVARFMESPDPPRVSDTVRFGVVTFCASDRDDAAGRARLDACIAGMRAALGDHVYAEGETTLAQHVVARLRARGETVAVAESCTGGLIAAALTDVAGSSDVFGEGCVTYAAAAKTRTLNVAADLIEREGVVSKAVACAMAEGVRARAGATFGVATTGIAGPDGGTAERPVGLVHYAVAGPAGTLHLRRQFPGDREAVRQFALLAALDLLRRQLA
jgi:nicotinamide-nucleotide amidase